MHPYAFGWVRGSGRINDIKQGRLISKCFETLVKLAEMSFQTHRRKKIGTYKCCVLEPVNFAVGLFSSVCGPPCWCPPTMSRDIIPYGQEKK
ncbi:unnamed protein product [Debaryomyces fabryi]|jgi:hypothetical protein|nr:unnamed protein product [Debaryomyces fabryi]